MGIDTLTFIKKEDFPRFIEEYGIEGLLKLRFYRWYSFCNYFGIEERSRVTSKELLKEMKIKTELEERAEELEEEAEEEENERKALAKLLAVKTIKEIANEEREELEDFYKRVFESFDIVFVPDTSKEAEELEKTCIEVNSVIYNVEESLKKLWNVSENLKGLIKFLLLKKELKLVWQKLIKTILKEKIGEAMNKIF